MILNFDIRQLYMVPHTILVQGYYDVFVYSKIWPSQLDLSDAVIMKAFEKTEDLIILYRHVLIDTSYRLLVKNMRYNFSKHINDPEDCCIVFSSPLIEHRNVLAYSLVKILKVTGRDHNGRNILHLYTLMQINNAVKANSVNFNRSCVSYLVVKTTREETEYVHVSSINHAQFLAVLTYASLL